MKLSVKILMLLAVAASFIGCGSEEPAPTTPVKTDSSAVRGAQGAPNTVEAKE